MLKNKTINMGVVKKVATALGELNDLVAYVGGARQITTVKRENQTYT